MKTAVEIANIAVKFLEKSTFVYDVKNKEKTLIVSVSHNLRMNLVDITIAPRFGRTYTISAKEFECRIKPIIRMYAGM